MAVKNGTTPILVAEDDPDDRALLREAFRECRLPNPVAFVHDGEKLMDFLKSGRSPPGLIILDLNMPRKGGRETLAELKSSEEWRSIPVIVLSTSQADEDIRQSYLLGASSFITKPVEFGSLVKIMNAIAAYWLDSVILPGLV